MREPVKQELTFQILDDFALGVQRGRVDASSVLPMLSVNDIGPLIELYLYARSDRPLIPSLSQLPQFKRVLALHQALEPSRRDPPLSLHAARTGRSVGFLATAHRSQAGLPWDDGDRCIGIECRHDISSGRDALPERPAKTAGRSQISALQMTSTRPPPRG